MFKIIPGIYLGWGLGANDAANVFGPQKAAPEVLST